MMPTPDLSCLFSNEISFSSGMVTTAGVEQLIQLTGDALPNGYDNWAEKRRREFRCGRHHAQLALEKAGARASLVLRDDDGVPLFPPGFHGSITHTGRSETFAAAVVSPSPRRVGIDAENHCPLADDMMKVVLSPTEIAFLKKQKPSVILDGTDSLGDRALLAFSAKEAFYKCTYPKHRTFLAFHDVEFTLHREAELLPSGDAVLGSFELRLLKPDVPSAPKNLQGRYLQLKERVLCSVEWPE